jgi:hypothetical protein
VGSVASKLLDKAKFPIEIGLHRGRRVVGALLRPLVDVVDFLDARNRPRSIGNPAASHARVPPARKATGRSVRSAAA